MSKKSKKKSAQGTYALCVTVGLIIGVGLGPMMGNFIVSSMVGAAIGAGAAYYFTHQKQRHKR
ncbi:MAG: hypothetical protein IIC60_06945 [Proteobacteria bacterium]|nr:hypothetical protein [Pseudomonadota bacterium]